MFKVGRKDELTRRESLCIALSIILKKELFLNNVIIVCI